MKRHREGLTQRRKGAKFQETLSGRVVENDVARVVVDAAVKVHSNLGPGLLESVYQVVLAHELTGRGHCVARQVAVPVVYCEVTFAVGFRMDSLVDDVLIVELKSVERVLPVHRKQLLTYLRLANKRLGLLLNLGAPLMKQGISRIVNGLPD